MKKPRNKKYKKKNVMPNSVAWAMAGAFKMPAEDVDMLMVPMRRAYMQFLAGIATRDDWNDLVTQFMIGEALAGMNIGNNLLPDITAAMNALRAIATRMIENKRSTCYASELRWIKEAADMYKIQLDHCTQGEFSRAHKSVKQSMECSDFSMLYRAMA